MVTRARDGIHLSNRKYANTATTPPTPAPTSVRAAMRDPAWLATMEEEFNALQSNQTWTLVPRPAKAHIVTGKWLFKNKLLPDGSLDRRKARWGVRRFTQRAGIDFHQTFSPVVKPATIRTVLQPAGFIDKDKPDHVCLLSKSLYGLKQAPCAWFQTFVGTLHTLGFLATGSDSSLFVYKHGNNVAYLLIYVDDIVLTVSSTALLQRIISHLSSTFAMKDLGPLHFFLGIQVRRTKDGFFLNQAQYAEEILDRAGMLHCKPAVTPIDTKPKVAVTDGRPADDASAYRSIADALQYLTMTRPDIAYAVHQVCLHMHAPHDTHWLLVKRILRSRHHGVRRPPPWLAAA
jgi:hypothetical protein